jgi:hypothetical protein
MGIIMGTRGSVGVIYQEKEKLGYNQFDSYPDGLGKDILNIVTKINRENEWSILKDRISKLKNVGEREIMDTRIMEKYKKYSDLSVSEQKLSDPYCLFRKIQGVDWIEKVYSGDLEDYPLNNEFIKDSLFCEYAYLINLDTMKLEFYSGFQESPQKDNRFGQTINEDGYYPCRLVGLFDISDIIDSDDIDKIVYKMNSIVESEKDDPSVLSYLRKEKLEKINE